MKRSPIPTEQGEWPQFSAPYERQLATERKPVTRADMDSALHRMIRARANDEAQRAAGYRDAINATEIARGQAEEEIKRLSEDLTIAYVGIAAIALYGILATVGFIWAVIR